MGNAIEFMFLSRLRKILPDTNYPWPWGKAFLSRLKHYTYKYYIEKARWKDKYFAANAATLDVDQLRGALLVIIEKSWTDKEPDGTPSPGHLATEIHDGRAHHMLCQKTFCAAMLELYSQTCEKGFLARALDLIHYVLAHQEANGLFRAHLPAGLAQDEGPITAGLIRCLVRATALTGDTLYLARAEKALSASLHHLYDPQKGFFHSLSQRFRCTNVTASYMAALTDLKAALRSELCDDTILSCLRVISMGQRHDGLFTYSEERPRVFRSLYHFLVMIALYSLRDQLSGTARDTASSMLTAAELYAGKLRRADGSVREDDMELYAFAQSVSRSALAALMAGHTEEADKALAFLSRFCAGSDFMLEMQEPGTVRLGISWRPRVANLSDVLLDVVLIRRHYQDRISRSDNYVDCPK